MVPPEGFFYVSNHPEAVFGLHFWADFLRDAVAAITGAGVGALLGARYAFGLERRKAAGEHDAAARAAALELKGLRATAGNLALFTLSQIFNDLLTYQRQLLAPAQKFDAPWFWLPPTRVSERNYYRFDLPSLAFLLQSQGPSAPEMLIKLALEQDRYAGFLDAVLYRTKVHEGNIPQVIERLQNVRGADYIPVAAELQQAVGPRIHAMLRNAFSDIEVLLQLGLQTSKATAEQLRALLLQELPGETIIGFETAEAVAGEAGSRLMRARNAAAKVAK